MTKRKYREATERRPQQPPASSAPSAADPPDTSSVSGLLQGTVSLHSLLCALLTDDTGWLRMVPGDKSELYVKWKWTAGPYSGHYVMAVGDVWQIEYLCALLLDKKKAVLDGAARPTKDKYYSPD